MFALLVSLISSQRWHIQMNFLEWKILYFDSNSLKVCFYGPNWQQTSIGLENGLVPNRWQTIIWANADLSHWHIYVALGGDELKEFIIWWNFHLSIFKSD